MRANVGYVIHVKIIGQVLEGGPTCRRVGAATMQERAHMAARKPLPRPAGAKNAAFNICDCSIGGRTYDEGSCPALYWISISYQ